MASRHKSRSVTLQALYQIELTGVSIGDALSFSWYDKVLEPEEKELAKTGNSSAFQWLIAVYCVCPFIV